MHIEALVCPVCGEVLKNYYDTDIGNYFFCRTCNLNFDIYPAIHKEYWYMDWDGIKIKYAEGADRSLLVFRTKETARRFIQDYISDAPTGTISIDDITFCPIDHFPLGAIDASDKYVKFNGDSHSLEDLPYVCS